MGRQNREFLVLCEDQQHEAFARRFLKKTKNVTHYDQIRVERAPLGRGAADHFVQENFIRWLRVLHHPKGANEFLVVVLDGDRFGVDGHLRQLDQACKRQDEPLRFSADRVSVIIPT